MILVDTSIWVDHFRNGAARLSGLLEGDEVLMHPWVTGELALGNMRQRDATLELLQGLPQAPVIGYDNVLAMITNEHLFGLGIGLVDAQLIASARWASGTLIWTRDRRLAGIADRMGLRFEPEARSSPSPSQ